MQYSQFSSAGHTIDVQAGKVIAPDGQVHPVRSKTFSLLLLLLQRPGQVVEKADILEQIWSDVVVDEQVIFQSIKELRKLFAGYEVIKTYPRKGYAWIPEVESLQEVKSPQIASSPPLSASAGDIQSMQITATAQTSNAKQETSAASLYLSHLSQFRSRWFIALIAFSAVLIVLITFINEQKADSNVAIKGSLVVLPFTTDLADTDHRWVRLGAMDQLIQQLLPSEQHGVMATDYVLEVMQRAEVGDLKNAQQQSYAAADIQQIFTVSGASLIVAAHLTGSIRDYQLIYSLYDKQGVQRGAVVAESVRDLVDKLAAILATRNGQSITALGTDYQSYFANEMLANAIELVQQRQFASAIAMLQAVLVSEPTNMTAKRFMALSMVQSGQSAEAESFLKQTLAELTAEAVSAEKVRLLFWYAVSLVQQSKIEAAFEALKRAEQVAEQAQDWLYLAYIAELEGKVYAYQQAYADAEHKFAQALNFHKVLQCPYGQSNIMLSMSELAQAKGDIEGARKLAEQVVLLSSQRELVKINQEAVEWLSTIEADSE